MNMYIIAGVACAAFLSGWLVQGWKADAEISAIHQENAEAIAVATAQAQQDTVKLQEKKDAALTFAWKKAKANQYDADTNRRLVDGLRDDLAKTATALSNAPSSAVVDYAITAGGLLNECSERLAGMAKKADGHATDSETLTNAWPK
jgi:hypothetical protein